MTGVNETKNPELGIYITYINKNILREYQRMKEWVRKHEGDEQRSAVRRNEGEQG